jgi:hypothetical protein
VEHAQGAHAREDEEHARCSYGLAEREKRHRDRAANHPAEINQNEKSLLHVCNNQ